MPALSGNPLVSTNSSLKFSEGGVEIPLDIVFCLDIVEDITQKGVAMKKIFSLFLIFSLLIFTSCTTLTGAERCALIGQIQEGTNISTQMATTGYYGGGIYSYPVETQNPICKVPKTDEEKAVVTDLLPTAQAKKKQKNTETWIAYGSLFAVLILSAIVGVGGSY